MTKIFATIIPALACQLLGLQLQAQSTALTAQLQQGYNRFAASDNMQFALVGFTVTDADGKTVFSNLGNAGLAPASCQKIVTAAAAFDQLGSNFRYSTNVSLSGNANGNMWKGDLLVQGSGDPTLASWRYKSVPDTAFFFQTLQALRQKGISRISGHIIGSNMQFSTQPIPGGWIYDDIGNYYGAGSWALNYHENQFDASFSATGNVGDRLPLKRTTPASGYDEIDSYVTLGQPGTGDNSIIYASPYSPKAYISGTLGKTNQTFTISGAISDGETALLQALADYLQRNGIQIDGDVRPARLYAAKQWKIPAATQSLTSFQSVGLDSVAYWFLQKSINLYGEALLKTLAVNAGKPGDTEAGAEWIRNFWAGKGIDRNALRVKDGSGLSPQNRVTANSLVAVLQYAKKQPWFAAYYEGFPLIHNIKMKSGTIGGAKGYTGYISDKNGKEYCFALLVNNYSGNANTVVQQMWQLLDVITQFK